MTRSQPVKPAPKAVNLSVRPREAVLMHIAGVFCVPAICLLIFCIGCLSDAAAKNSTPSTTAPKPRTELKNNIKQDLSQDSVTVFLTGNTLGALKPCGCVSGQLGGLGRRAAILNKVGHDKKLAIDTGNFVNDDTRQNVIKFSALLQGLSVLEYDLVNLTKKDMTIAKDLGLLEGNAFDIISYGTDNDKIPPKYTRQMQIGEHLLAITVATVSSESKKPFETVEKLFSGEQEGLRLNILITNDCDRQIAGRIADTSLVDVLVCPPSSDEPEILDEKEKTMLSISVGQLGRYVGKLMVRVGRDKQIKLDYTKVTVSGDLAQDQGLVELYEYYQYLVKEEGLLEEVIRVPLPDNLEYLGSKSCAMGGTCHQYEYEKWSTKPHARAYQTLVKVNSQYDPECVKCHVVGLEYEGGFESESSDKGLRNVGCESCHGPGSGHLADVLTGQRTPKTSGPKSNCIDCHDSEHSSYEAHKDEFLKKIVHWKELKAGKDVEQ